MLKHTAVCRAAAPPILQMRNDCHGGEKRLRPPGRDATHRRPRKRSQRRRTSTGRLVAPPVLVDCGTMSPCVAFSPMRPTFILLLLAGTRAALRVGFARAPVLLMCSPSEEPIVNRETLARIQSELYRTEETDREALVREQSDLIRSLLSDISAALPETKVDMGGDAVVNGERTDADVVGLPAEEAGISLAEIDGSLNAVVGPHLPVLLGASFPMAARDVLVQLRSEEERTALLALSRFVMGVQAEVGGALQELQWRQQQKLRELCDAASEGGTERLIELAEAMRDELDTDFCNYLNYAIEQEEVKLQASGAKPFEPPLPPYAGGGAASLPPEYQKELEEEEQAARLEAAMRQLSS